MSSFWKAFVATAVPLSALTIVSFTAHLPEFMMGVTAICFMLVMAGRHRSRRHAAAAGGGGDVHRSGGQRPGPGRYLFRHSGRRSARMIEAGG